jgi:type IV secretory system VirB8-like protein/TrbC/VIRB2 family pilin
MAHLARIKLPSPIRLAASSRLAKSALLVLSLLVVTPLAAHAQGSPFDTGFNAIQGLFTGTIAKVASLVAIVIGGYGLPYIDVEIKNVILDDLRQSPYSARIEFEKVYSNPADHSELKRERWTASVTYVFRENVRNNELAVNPLGLTIVRFRADQAFS